eukprot:jgi/Botrbrau1/18183/Bobra.53_1s0049.2
MTVGKLINLSARGTQQGLSIKRQRNHMISKAEKTKESFRGDLKPSLNSERLRGSQLEATTSGRGREAIVEGDRNGYNGMIRRETSLDRSTTLSLSNIRQTLIRQEDTIIYSIIERAQFARNAAIYESGAIPIPSYDLAGRQASLLEYLLRETEHLHGRIRRYTSPDEHAFYPLALPSLILPPLTFPQVLAACATDININDRIMAMYLKDVVCAITEPGDDNNYGSAALCDVLCLQAISKRVHYGKFVAEAKFAAHPATYTSLIKQHDTEGLMDLLTDVNVENKVLQRVRRKAEMYGQDLDDVSASGDGQVGLENRPSHYKVDPKLIADLYERWVMPLTKEVQIAYLLRRVDS